MNYIIDKDFNICEFKFFIRMFSSKNFSSRFKIDFYAEEELSLNIDFYMHKLRFKVGYYK